MDIQREFYKAILNNDIENVKLFLNNKKVNPRQNNSWAFELAVNAGNYNIVELLLIDNRIDPTDYNNYYIKFAFNKKYSISRLQLPLYRYRKHNNNLTNDKKKIRFLQQLIIHGEHHIF